MEQEYGIKPELSHYNAVLDTLSQSWINFYDTYIDEEKLDPQFQKTMQQKEIDLDLFNKYFKQMIS